MGLAEVQRLLARLYTDAPLRARFADDPVGVAAEFGLSPEEAEGLEGLPLGQLDDFAGSLVRKRRGEVESLLPLTYRALGPGRFASLFRRHAQGFVPAGIKKHRDDAVAFAAFLNVEVADPPWLGDLARLEASSILAHDPARRRLVLRLGHHPLELARVATDGGPAPGRRPTWAFWFRASAKGRLRRVVLSRPW
jgi:hypothetical protein